MPRTLARIFVHVVFSTNDRAPLLKDPIRPQLFAYLGAIVFSSHVWGVIHRRRLSCVGARGGATIE